MAQPEMTLIIEGLNQDWQQFLQGHLIAVWQMAVHSIQMVINPYCFAGLVSYALSTVCWLAILSKVDLSFAYPMISIGYVAVLLMGAFVFGEEVTLLRWLGVVLIGVGIVSIFSEAWFGRNGLYAAALLLLLSAILWGTGQSVKPAEYFDKPVLFLAVTLSLGIVGQILFKMGMNKEVNKERVKTIGSSVKSLAESPGAKALDATVTAVRLFVSPYVFAGLASYALSTILWVMLLKIVPLSFLYPLLSVGYVVILLISKLAFHENVSFLRWYGVLMICFGIVVIFSEETVSANLLAFVGVLALMALSLGAYTIWMRRRCPVVS